MMPHHQTADGSRDPPVIAVVGAGFSGTMAAIHLRHRVPADHVIHLFDRSCRFARGPAYAASDMPHLLNVRAANMSALPDDPGHFRRWLDAQAERFPDEIHATEAGVFATRRLYGRYLRGLLHAEMKQSGGRVRLHGDAAVGLERTPTGWLLRCASGRTVAAAAVVLGIGNLPSTRKPDGLVFYDPWLPEATSGLRPDAPVLIVGTGLSMVDLVLGMRAHGFAGQVIALSRRGLTPLRHGPPRPPWPCAPFGTAETASLSTLLHSLRGRIRAAAAEGVDWRAVLDGMRPVTTCLWRALPPAERARFLRHVRPYWDVHRHRLAPATADRFQALVAQGQVRLCRGRLREIVQNASPGGDAEVVFQARGDDALHRLSVQRVIFATGTGEALDSDPLITALLATGLGRTDCLGLGLEATETLQLVARDGAVAPRVWALGPIVRGVFWECTAVPDIRQQAARLGQAVAEDLAARR
jgi:uncharacterized NAD(P)/FAD-binding protein YdhS